MNRQNDNGLTALHMAAIFGNLFFFCRINILVLISSTCCTLHTDYVQIAKMLIDSNANLDIQDEDGYTPIISAAIKSSFQ